MLQGNCYYKKDGFIDTFQQMGKFQLSNKFLNLMLNGLKIFIWNKQDNKYSYKNLKNSEIVK